jgi:hypothetical protein
MGAYRSHGSPPEYVYVKFEGNRVKQMVCNRQNPLSDDDIERLGLEDTHVFILERKYGKCKESSDLRRMTGELANIS